MDLKLDTTSHDLTLTDGLLDTTQTGGELVRQKIALRLRIQTGGTDWRLDTELGIDWRGKVLVKAPDLAVVRSLLVAQVSQVQGVQAIRAIKLTQAPGRLLDGEIRVVSDDDEALEVTL